MCCTVCCLGTTRRLEARRGVSGRPELTRTARAPGRRAESAAAMKGPRPGWDKDMHFVRSADFFRSAHAKLVSCGNQFELIGAQARGPPSGRRRGAGRRRRALAEQRRRSPPLWRAPGALHLAARS